LIIYSNIKTQNIKFELGIFVMFHICKLRQIGAMWEWWPQQMYYVLIRAIFNIPKTVMLFNE